jgi:hypothetical protein
MTIYWKSKLERKVASEFTLDDMTQTGDAIKVDCQGCKGKLVRFHFRFSPSGKIIYTKCGPLPAQSNTRAVRRCS